MSIINMECSNCHTIQQVNTDFDNGCCKFCGYRLYDNSIQESVNLYNNHIKSLKRKRLMYRLLFIILELFSFIFTLIFCNLFAIVLDTKMFMENNWLIFAVWIIIAYIIYRKFEYKIR